MNMIGRIGLKLAAMGGALPRITPELIDGARAAVLQIDRDHSGTNGEYKRHQAYSRLLKEFPTESKAAIALAIEVAKCSAA